MDNQILDIDKRANYGPCAQWLLDKGHFPVGLLVNLATVPVKFLTRFSITYRIFPIDALVATVELFSEQVVSPQPIPHPDNGDLIESAIDNPCAPPSCPNHGFAAFSSSGWANASGINTVASFRMDRNLRAKRLIQKIVNARHTEAINLHLLWLTAPEPHSNPIVLFWQALVSQIMSSRVSGVENLLLSKIFHQKLD